ncbi:methionine ABC transporter ATP-binding protein [Orrella marina]|uniref:Cell division ATP-binding protein FtsE n=1 Tax=Orrella marina TaxID=2163011 RepID=A0A2R4XMS6_9BURK|nr:ATP-binding cassette domain-containing protein [Orrella marina]AWB35103.1 methionine ABC transporter ATP-binding protein [Orrella marina]
MIQLENIRKSYLSAGREVVALSDINLRIEQGEVFGIIGRSGAGKSTLIRLLNLLERPTTGRVILNDQCISELAEPQLRVIRQKIGMVFQHFNLLQSRSVLDNVCFPLKLAGMSRQAQKNRALEVLELVGLADHAAKYPRQLSGGQQQRVGIARALANRPDLLLCDEATSALDPETTQSILKLLREINQRLGLTIVLITHSMDVIRQICHRVAVIERGVLVESGDVLEVFLHPKDATTQSLLAQSGNDTEGWRDMVRTTQGRIMRLSFKGKTATQPLISRLSRELNLDVSILQGSVGQINATPYGQLVIQAEGAPEELARLESAMNDLGIQHEELHP